MNFEVQSGSGHDQLITATEFIKLSQANKWGENRVYDLEQVDRALRNTFYLVVIRSIDGDLIGCVRALSDDLFFTTIPDIFVYPQFQRKGFGKLLMEKLKERLGHTVIFFGAQAGKESFYENLGFEKGLPSYVGKFTK